MADEQKKLELEITGMTCEHCAKSIERKLSNLDGVLESSIDYQTGKGEVSLKGSSPDPKKVVDQVNSMSREFPSVPNLIRRY
jgi:mercuric reductase